MIILSLRRSSSNQSTRLLSCSRSIRIGKMDAPLVELVGRIEPRGIIHCYLGTKATITKVGPVTHFAVANAHEIAQTVTRHVRQVNGFNGRLRNRSPNRSNAAPITS